MLRMSQVPNYLYTQYEVVRCTKAVRLWYLRGLKVGDRYVHLRVEVDNMGQQYTRKEWVDSFIEKVSTR